MPMLTFLNCYFLPKTCANSLKNFLLQSMLIKGTAKIDT
jgi:hypothetical protein